ncbi:MAG: hypothetical protein ABR502_00245 [Chitinophagaceae bacterium]
MKAKLNIPDPKSKKKDGYDTDSAKQKESGTDSLFESSPTDSNADEKVIVNSEKENKIVNAPSQTAPNTSGNDGDII